MCITWLQFGGPSGSLWAQFQPNMTNWRQLGAQDTATLPQVRPSSDGPKLGQRGPILRIQCDTLKTCIFTMSNVFGFDAGSCEAKFGASYAQVGPKWASVRPNLRPRTAKFDPSRLLVGPSRPASFLSILFSPIPWARVVIEIERER